MQQNISKLCSRTGVLLILVATVPVLAAGSNADKRATQHDAGAASNTAAGAERAARTTAGKTSAEGAALRQSGQSAGQRRGDKIRLEGEELLIMKESDVSGVQRQPEDKARKNGSPQQLQDAFLNPVRKQKQPQARPASGYGLNEQTPATRQKGAVKWFNTEKGYGFIAPAEGGKDAGVPADRAAPALKETPVLIESVKDPGRTPHAGSSDRTWPNKWSGPSTKSSNTGNDSSQNQREGRHTPFFNNYRPQFYMRRTNRTVDGSQGAVRSNEEMGAGATRPGGNKESTGQASGTSAQPGMFGRKNPHQQTRKNAEPKRRLMGNVEMTDEKTGAALVRDPDEKNDRQTPLSNVNKVDGLSVKQKKLSEPVGDNAVSESITGPVDGAGNGGQSEGQRFDFKNAWPAK